MRSVNYVDGHACPNGLKFSLSLKECRGPVSGIFYLFNWSQIFMQISSPFSTLYLLSFDEAKRTE